MSEQPASSAGDRILKSIAEARAAIQSDIDHAWAVEEIRRLWGSEEGTPNGDLLSILMVIACAYEEEHHIIEPPEGSKVSQE
jgi:antitoxin component HigA of HigAB toxin-antitoxin module